MTLLYRRCWLPLALLALTAARVSPQAAPYRVLAPPSAEFADPFSSVTQLVELRDGRVLLFDAIERRFGIADLERGGFTEVARSGGGPREYRAILAAFRIAGDSVLAWDPANDRIHLLTPDGTLVGPWARNARDARTMAMVRSIPREVDEEGRVYASIRRVTAGDTTWLVRLVPATGAQDTLASFSTPQLRPARASTGVVRVRAPGFPAQDAWGVFPDGRVLIVHGGTYTPEIVLPTGTRTRARPVPFTPQPVTAGDRAQHLREVGLAMEGMLRREAGGGRAAAIPRVEVVEPDAWPAQRPPVRDVRIRVDSRQRAWVRVTDAASQQGERYDLLDADGRLVAAVRMPKGVVVVGMGKDVLYGTREDEDGLLYLRRYPLP